jgi:hypothetical protein
VSVFDRFRRLMQVEGWQIIFVIWMVLMGILWGLL